MDVQFLFCTNGHCKKLLTDFELKRIEGKLNCKRTRHKFCVGCRKNDHKITHIRCVVCKSIFSNFNSIFQTHCKNCYRRNQK